jgi:hypothetical protein
MNRIVLLTLVALSVLCAPAKASPAGEAAGRYVVSACRAGSTPILNTTWVRDSRYAANGTYDECAAGGSFGIIADQLGLAVGTGARWTMHAPPGTIVWGLRLWRFVRAPKAEGSDRWYAYRLENQSGYPLEFTGNGISSPLGGNPVSAPLRPPDEFSELNAQSLSFVYSCSRDLGVQPACGKEDYAQLLVFKTEVTLRDEMDPTITDGPRGDLVSGGELRGTHSLVVDATDEGGGLLDAQLIVDGKTVATASFDRTGGCREPFVQLVPCPTSGQAQLSLDTTRLTDGSHELLVVVHDATGTNAATSRALTIDTDNSVPVPLPPPAAPVKPKTSNATAASDPVLSVAFANSARAAIRASATKPPTVEGRLLDRLGQPIQGAVIEFATRDARVGASFAVQPALTTDAAGRFAIRVPAGPSRELRFRYRAYLEDADVAAENRLSVVVPAPVQLRTNRGTLRNGQTVRFNGRIPGASDEDRTRVEFQAHTPRGWRTFKTVAMRNGRFGARYRFTGTFATTRYSFRAIAHADPSFAYATGRSRPVKVLVRP